MRLSWYPTEAGKESLSLTVMELPGQQETREIKTSVNYPLLKVFVLILFIIQTPIKYQVSFRTKTGYLHT